MRSGLGSWLCAKIKYNNMSEIKTYPKVTILGDMPSKSNQYRIITIKGHSSLAKTTAVKKYEENFYKQNFLRDENIKGFFEVEVDVFFQSNRKDLDGAFKLFLDVLQSTHTIVNDRQCTKIVARKFIDRNNPRVEFVLKEVADVEVVDSKQPTLDFKD